MTTLTHTQQTLTSQPNLFQRFLDWMVEAFVVSNLNLSRREQIEALEAKTDAELAEMGIRRDMIAHHVFHDLYYA